MGSSGRATAVDELAAVPMLARLPRQRLAALAASCPVRSFPVGALLLRRGDPASSLLVVLAGEVGAVVEHASGNRSRYPLMAGPCVIDKAAVLAGRSHSATWVAATPGRAMPLGAATFASLLADERELRDHVLSFLAGQVCQARAALADQAAGSARLRLARWLLAAGRGGGSVIRLSGGQQGMAEELGLSRVTVNRALRQLASAGAVCVRPGAVIILDPGVLAMAADTGGMWRS